jgi:hypothetical protein
MKKVFITTLASLGFLVIFGVLFLIYHRPIMMAYHDAFPRQPVSVCTEMKYRNYQLYGNEKDNIYLKGYLYGGKDLLLSDYDVNNCEESIIKTDIAQYIPKNVSVDPEVIDLIERLRNYPNESEEILRVEVILDGQLIENKSTSSPKHEIQVASLGSIGVPEKVNRNELLRK